MLRIIIVIDATCVYDTSNFSVPQALTAGFPPARKPQHARIRRSILVATPNVIPRQLRMHRQRIFAERNPGAPPEGVLRRFEKRSSHNARYKW